MTEETMTESGFRAIVVPVDGSARADTALVPALALARAADVPIVFFRWEADPSAVGAADQCLDDLVERYGGDLKTDRVLATAAHGDVAEALVAQASTRQALICMASHGRSRVGKALLGSVTTDVVSLTTAPVLVVGPDLDPKREIVGQRLGVCLDGSRFAEQILPVAVSWAAAFGLSPWLLESATQDDLADLARAPTLDVVESGYVARIAQRLPMPANWDVLHADHPADAIVSYAQVQPVGVLAMATHGRRGWSRMAEGSVALQVLQRAPCPVLLVRPPDDTVGGEGG